MLTQEINDLQVRIDEKKSLRSERWETVMEKLKMEKLISWINENIYKEHGLITGSVAHYNMVRIHPFDDGNGRGARLLMNLIFIKKSCRLRLSETKGAGFILIHLPKRIKVIWNLLCALWENRL